MTTTTTTPAEAIAAEYLDLKARAADIDERIKQIVAELRDLGPGRHAAGTHSITVTTQRRFNADHAADVLAGNPELLAACQETVISSAKAKQVLAPAMYELCMLEAGDARVSIR